MNTTWMAGRSAPVRRNSLPAGVFHAPALEPGRRLHLGALLERLATPAPTQPGFWAVHFDGVENQRTWFADPVLADRHLSSLGADLGWIEEEL